MTVPADQDLESQVQERRSPLDGLIFDFVLLAFAMIIIFDAFGLRPGSRLVPLVIGIPTVVALVVQSGIDIARFRIPETEASVGELDPADLANARLVDLVAAAAQEEAEDSELPSDEEARRRQLLFALWASGVAVVAVLTSFYVAAPIGLVTILIAVGRGPTRAFLVTLGVMAFLYLAFDVLLNVPF